MLLLGIWYLKCPRYPATMACDACGSPTPVHPASTAPPSTAQRRAEVSVGSSETWLGRDQTPLIVSFVSSLNQSTWNNWGLCLHLCISCWWSRLVPLMYISQVWKPQQLWRIRMIVSFAPCITAALPIVQAGHMHLTNRIYSVYIHTFYVTLPGQGSAQRTTAATNSSVVGSQLSLRKQAITRSNCWII